jgi:regulatory protein
VVPRWDHPNEDALAGPRPSPGEGVRGGAAVRAGGGLPERKRPRGTARDRALNLLSHRDRSHRELERRLLQAGYEPEEVAEALEALQRSGLVDDERFARAVVEQEAGRRLSGRRAVAAALASKGVDGEAAQAALADLDDLAGERDRAEALASARAGRLAGLPPEVAHRRLTGLLARRGYPPGVARDAARRALGLDAAED